jgi:hypothetical protein
MKIAGLLLSLFLIQPCMAQFKMLKLDKNSIPKKIRYQGKTVQAVRWTDSTGDNIVILTSEKIINKTASREQLPDGDLFANHYLVSGDSIQATWKVYDYIKECAVDMFLYFIDKTFAVTDLDKDGKAEVWMMYKVSCQGDISPVPMKIIMYEDNKKFSARGTTRVGEQMGGEYVFDNAFKNAPAAFRKYAENLWNKHKKETWQQ